MPLVVDKKEAAELLNCTPKTIDDYERQGLLVRSKLPGAKYSLTTLQKLAGDETPTIVHALHRRLAEKDEEIAELKRQLVAIANIALNKHNR